jgi:hypothetical protein
LGRGAVKEYWGVLILGAIAPWFIVGRHMLKAFKDGGLQAGLGYWLGGWLFTTVFLFVLIGLVRFLNSIFG